MPIKHPVALESAVEQMHQLCAYCEREDEHRTTFDHKPTAVLLTGGYCVSHSYLALDAVAMATARKDVAL